MKRTLSSRFVLRFQKLNRIFNPTPTPRTLVREKEEEVYKVFPFPMWSRAASKKHPTPRKKKMSVRMTLV